MDGTRVRTQYREPLMGYDLAMFYKLLSYSDGQEPLQLQHRMALVNMWVPRTGDRVLEMGCGQGETTVALMAADEVLLSDYQRMCANSSRQRTSCCSR